MTQLTPTAEALLRAAEDIANIRGHKWVGTEHILLAMTRQTQDSLARRTLDEVGTTEALREQLEAIIGED